MVWRDLISVINDCIRHRTLAVHCLLLHIIKHFCKPTLTSIVTKFNLIKQMCDVTREYICIKGTIKQRGNVKLLRPTMVHLYLRIVDHLYLRTPSISGRSLSQP